MSESSSSNAFGFGKFVPGFDFLQNLAKGAGQSIPQMPSLSSWVAPTLNVEELNKRLQELKAVQFWLEQNARALGATIQALELQKMTLATLQGMNFNMADLANAFKLDIAGGLPETGQAAGNEGAASETTAAASGPAAADQPAGAGKEKASPAAGAAIDPLQWWGALTQQFQQIATSAMQDAAQKTAADAARATGVAQEAFHAATEMAQSVAGGGVRPEAPAPAKKKTPARKTAAGRSPAR